MTRHLRDLTSTENLLVVSSRFWFKAHMYRCNTPLILLRDVFKSANLSNSIRDFHSVMMALAHMTKSKLSPNYQTPVTCLLYTSPSPRDPKTSRMPSSA